MTKTQTNKGLKNLLTLLVVFLLAAALAIVTACGNNGDSTATDTTDTSSSTPASSTTVDTHKLLNGNFEYYAEGDNVTFPYKSSIRWTNTRSYIVSTSDYAPASDASSGIIPTSKTEYDELMKTAVGDQTLGDYLVKDGATFYPYSPSHYGYTEADENRPESSKGDRVLMIHNRIKSAPGQGTAQYFYTSGSTLSLAAGKYGKLTVWVNTFGLSTEMNTEDYGAYVRIVNRISSTGAPDVFIKNIKTDGQWVKIEAYLEANEFASSSYTLYLGLGLGSSHVQAEYVEGFAFFDDVTFEEIEKKDYLDATKDLPADHRAFAFEENENVELGTDKVEIYPDYEIVENSLANEESYASAKYSVSHAVDFHSIGISASDADIKANDEAFADATHKQNAREMVENNVSVGMVRDITVSIDGAADDKAFLGKDDDGNDKVLFEESTKFVYFNFDEYSASATVKIPGAELEPDQYVILTFWAKVKVDREHNGATGLSFIINDCGDGLADESAFHANTIISASNSLNSDNNGWRRYTVLIQNTVKSVNPDGTEADDVPERSFEVVINFGPTDKLNEKESAFPKGYALIGDFRAAAFSEESHSLISTNNTVNLSAEIINTRTDGGDTYIFGGRQSEIESGILSQPLSTVQVYGVGNSNSGVFNTEYLDKIENAQLKAYLQLLADADDMHDGVNDYIQALAIGDATGYYTGKNTLSANSLAKVSVKLATIGGATAYVNVLDRDTVPEHDGTGYNILTIAKDDIKVNTELAGDIVFSKAVSTGNDLKWVTVTFYIASGSKAIDFGVEVWNGERFSGEAQGVVIVDSITISTTATETFKDIKENAEDDGAEYTDYTFDYAVYRYNADNKEEQITTEVGGEENFPVYNVYANVGLMFESETDDSYTLYGNVLATNYEDKVYVTVAKDDEEESSTEESSDPNALPSEVRWLAISSIVLAIVLILVLAAVVVRLIIKKASAKRDVTVSYYDRGAREKAQEKISANKAKRSAQKSAESEKKPEEKPEEQPEEEEEEYDYDAAGNIDESADQPEEPAEEPAEQPADQPEEAATDSENAPSEEENK